MNSFSQNHCRQRFTKDATAAKSGSRSTSRSLRLMQFITALMLLAVMNLAAALDINIANAEQIAQELKGVGLKKAQAIVDYRTTVGRFKNVDDLLKVKGVGKKLVQLNAENITFGPSNSK